MNHKKLKYLNELIKTIAQIKTEQGKDFYKELSNDLNSLLNNNNIEVEFDKFNGTNIEEENIDEENPMTKLDELFQKIKDADKKRNIKENENVSIDYDAYETESNNKESDAIVNELVEEYAELLLDVTEFWSYINKILSDDELQKFYSIIVTKISENGLIDLEYLQKTDTPPTNSKSYGINPSTYHYDVCKCLACQEYKQYLSQTKIHDYITEGKGIKLIQLI